MLDIQAICSCKIRIEKRELHAFQVKLMLKMKFRISTGRFD